jgi:hypothetical protein
MGLLNEYEYVLKEGKKALYSVPFHQVFKKSYAHIPLLFLLWSQILAESESELSDTGHPAPWHRLQILRLREAGTIQR